MTKWLIITLFTVTGFMVVLLGLGYLLSENEKTTTQLKNELALEAQLAQQKASQRKNLNDYPITVTAADGSTIVPQIISLKPRSSLSTTVSAGEHDSIETATDEQVMQQFENTFINNLTCVTSTQCQTITVSFKNKTCTLASNLIGASQLKKIATKRISLDNCPLENSQNPLVCQQNICTFAETRF